MTDERRILELLEEILDSGSEPEAVCQQSPELLPEVRARLQRLRSIEGQIDEMFPLPVQKLGAAAQPPGYAPCFPLFVVSLSSSPVSYDRVRVR